MPGLNEQRIVKRRSFFPFSYEGGYVLPLKNLMTCLKKLDNVFINIMVIGYETVYY